MARFTVNCELQDLTGNRPPAAIADVMVDTGSEYTWLPEDLLREAGVTVTKKDIAFVMANGATITRDIGYAYLRSGEFETVDEVVFARRDDLRLLGARTLEGFAARFPHQAPGGRGTATGRPCLRQERPVVHYTCSSGLTRGSGRGRPRVSKSSMTSATTSHNSS